ncbi:hypothetical protein BCR32DRAFT_276016 [Anaeromyces robustus]|uniref:Uncharacterized protein n=1 Tax=Anaeromyces robustus TaxID=1754192 RepID=A0A1Y1XJC5_9FUNG|nr:hypothetical protein BCR32DRAFT_276016 [Anaeromyces robustus]|eukprot:ORX85802.1 hypothetical protein BCR32DRAFT_276016 [Anaeromyces robustus]
MKIKNDINIANNRYYNLNFTDNYILAPVYNNKVNLKNQCITMTHTHINKFIQDSFYYRINGKETPDVTNFLNNIKIIDTSIIKDSFLNIRYYRNKDKLS